MNDNDKLAKKCSEVMHTNDKAAQMLGIKILTSTPGYAELCMTVREEFSNGHDICHGGILFTLADTAFAHACNNSNQNTVASGASIQFLAPGKVGDVLTAVAYERSRGGKTGVYDIEIKNQLSTTVALFRGNSYQIKGQLIATGDIS